MILSKAPLRVSVLGGSSDVKAFYSQAPGACFSIAIDKYVYVSVMKTPNKHIKISYSKQETVTNVDDIQNDIVRETLRYFNIESNIEITSFADIPTIGSGLAGSSAFTCALIVALAEYTRQELSTYEVAELACKIEIERCGWNIGKQDQYASAFGGTNLFGFGYYYPDNDRVIVEKIQFESLANECLLIPTNIERHASSVIDTIDFKDKFYHIEELADLARSIRVTNTIEELGKHLDAAWKIKRETSSAISNPVIDGLYQTCLDHGSYGAKLLGAGGGGYMLALHRNPAYLSEFFPNRTCLTFKESEFGARVVYSD